MSDNHPYLPIDLTRNFQKNTPIVIYVEGAFGGPEGKTAHRLIHQGEIFDVEAVIDSQYDGRSVSEVGPEFLDADIPIISSFEKAFETVQPEVLVIGTAPLGGQLSEHLLDSIETALLKGVDVVSGLHQHLCDREHLAEVSEASRASMYDIRKAPPQEHLREADGRISELSCDIVTIMGTDCVSGKGTTTYELYDIAKSKGYDTAFVATGQTGILSGSKYGIPTDKIPLEYAVGAVEEVVYQAGCNHDLVFVEGQAALTHPRFVGDDIIKGSQPDCVVLADNPYEQNYEYFDMEKRGVRGEIRAIESLVDTKVVALSTQAEDSSRQQKQYGITAGNVLKEDGRRRVFEKVSRWL